MEVREHVVSGEVLDNFFGGLKSLEIELLYHFQHLQMCFSGFVRATESFLLTQRGVRGAHRGSGSAGARRRGALEGFPDYGTGSFFLISDELREHLQDVFWEITSKFQDTGNDLRFEISSMLSIFISSFHIRKDLLD